MTQESKIHSTRVDSRHVLLAVGAVVLASVAFSRGNKTMEEPTNAKEAIAELLAGNARFVAGMNKSHKIEIERADLASGQAPFAAVIRCADSRVAPEICFDQQLGRLFVCAIAGNITTPEITASLEYGVAVLGTKAIVVMGHSSCGALGAALEHRQNTSELPGSLPILIDQIISPCAMNLDPSDPKSLGVATACNANMVAKELIRRSPVIAAAVEAGELQVIAGVQDLKSGRFELTSN